MFIIFHRKTSLHQEKYLIEEAMLKELKHLRV